MSNSILSAAVPDHAWLPSTKCDGMLLGRLSIAYIACRHFWSSLLQSHSLACSSACAFAFACSKHVSHFACACACTQAHAYMQCIHSSLEHVSWHASTGPCETLHLYSLTAFCSSACFRLMALATLCGHLCIFWHCLVPGSLFCQLHSGGLLPSALKVVPYIGR